MPGFMNAELERIRDNLKCNHCGCLFVGSDSQARKVKYENLNVYCSPACRTANARARLCKPVPNRGPCQQCGETFYSRTAKKYCSLSCYTKSDQFRKMVTQNTNNQTPTTRAKVAEKQRKGKYADCLECGESFYQKRACKSHPNPKKFCCQPCYRAYMAKRFDRWIANPEQIALPQNYDEFLDREELPCLIDGCNWKGKMLTLHVNQAHGITAREFKKIVGFNLGTGVISSDMARLLSDRENIGVAIEGNQSTALALANQALNGQERYISKESHEHRVKARALVATGAGPNRRCLSCGGDFVQSTPFGRAKYCSIECRSKYYREKR